MALHEITEVEDSRRDCHDQMTEGGTYGRKGDAKCGSDRPDQSDVDRLWPAGLRRRLRRTSTCWPQARIAGLPTRYPFVSAALDATGGLAAWEQCKRIEFRALVTACEGNGCFYLTEHDFVLCPWSEAIQVTAHEPRADFTWQVVRGRYYARQADPIWTSRRFGVCAVTTPTRCSRSPRRPCACWRTTRRCAPAGGGADHRAVVSAHRRGLPGEKAGGESRSLLDSGHLLSEPGQAPG